VPDSASGVFLLAPTVVFASYLILGLVLPTVYVSGRGGPDLLLVIALLGLAKFAITLAAFDAGLYGAIIAITVITAVITPPVLGPMVRRGGQGRGEGEEG